MKVSFFSPVSPPVGAEHPPSIRPAAVKSARVAAMGRDFIITQSFRVGWSKQVYGLVRYWVSPRGPR